MDSQLSAVPGNAVSSAVLDHLARTKGWTRFISVLLWVGSGFLVLGGLAMIAMGSMGGAFGGAEMGALAGFAGGLIVGIIYIVMAALYIYPALKLGNYSSRISALLNAPSESNLASALNEQRAFWKFSGIMMIILIAIYLIAIPAAVIFAGVSSAASM